MVSEVINSKTVVASVFFGFGLLLSGQQFFGVLISALGLLFGIKKYERLKLQEIDARSDKDILLVKKLNISSLYSQNFISVYFACVMWMVAGNLRLITLQHWKTGFETGFLGATALTAIEISPLSRFLLAGKYRTFFVSSLVVSLVDRLIHPSHFGGPYGEALVTGLSAAGINISIDALYEAMSYVLRL